MTENKQDYVLYRPKNNAQVPSFLSNSQSNKGTTITLRHSGRDSIISPNKDTVYQIITQNNFPSIDQQICSSSEPINLINSSSSFQFKFKSEQSDNSNQKQIFNQFQQPSFFTIVKLCNPQLLDSEIKKRKDINCSPKTLFENGNNNNKTQKKYFVRSSKQQMRETFTLNNLTLSKQECVDIQDRLNKNKINSAPQKQQKQQTKLMKNNNSMPKFDKYVSKEIIRSHDMIYNVQHLMKLQRKRELEYTKSRQNDPEQQLEIIKRKNQIQSIMSNTKKLDTLKSASGGIISHIKEQDQQADKIFDQFRHKLGFS